MKVLILFYSMYGHVHKLAEAAADGVKEVPGAEPVLRRVPETLSPEILEKMGAVETQKAFEHIPVCTVDELGGADAVMLGTPTRFGNMCGQMRQFLDSTGKLWVKRALVGKVGGVFTSTGTQHGGQETTIISTMMTMLHHGMVIAGLPYAFEGQGRMDEITGCSPYGASTIAAGDNSRMPTDNELDGARWQGRYLAEIASRLAEQA